MQSGYHAPSAKWERGFLRRTPSPYVQYGSIDRPKNPSPPIAREVGEHRVRQYCALQGAGATHIGNMASERNTAAYCVCALWAAWYPDCIAYVCHYH